MAQQPIKVLWDTTRYNLIGTSAAYVNANSTKNSTAWYLASSTQGVIRLSSDGWVGSYVWCDTEATSSAGSSGDRVFAAFLGASTVYWDDYPSYVTRVPKTTAGNRQVSFVIKDARYVDIGYAPSTGTTKRKKVWVAHRRFKYQSS